MVSLHRIIAGQGGDEVKVGLSTNRTLEKKTKLGKRQKQRSPGSKKEQRKAKSRRKEEVGMNLVWDCKLFEIQTRKLNSGRDNTGGNGGKGLFRGNKQICGCKTIKNGT